MQEPTLAQRTAALLRGVDILAIKHQVKPDKWLEPETGGPYDYNFRFANGIYIYRCWAITEYGQGAVRGAVRGNVADHFNGTLIKEAWKNSSFPNAVVDILETENQDATHQENLP